MKKLIVFDLDGTLAESKSAIDDEMAARLCDLLGVLRVAVISGGDWPQFEKQVLSHLPHDERLKQLSILPTCGTKFFQYDGAWKKLYSEDFNDGGRAKVTGSLPKAHAAPGRKPGRGWGGVAVEWAWGTAAGRRAGGAPGGWGGRSQPGGGGTVRGVGPAVGTVNRSP